VGTTATTVYTSNNDVLPAGTYVVQANVSFGHNSVGGPTLTCSLVVGNSSFATTHFQSTAPVGDVYQTLNLVAGGTIPAANSGTVRVQCTRTGNAINAVYTTVTAIQTTTFATLGAN
jgi:hypothetical protein